MEDNDNHSGDNNKYININKHNNYMAEIKGPGTFKLKYTELINEVDEIDGEMLIKSNDINYTIQRFMESRHIIKLDIKQLNNK
jgi:hypothetical protein